MKAFGKSNPSDDKKKTVLEMRDFLDVKIKMTLETSLEKSGSLADKMRLILEKKGSFDGKMMKTLEKRNSFAIKTEMVFEEKRSLAGKNDDDL